MGEYADFSPLSCFSGTLNKFVCLRCDGVFCSPVALSLHVEKRHGLLFRIKCGNCGMGFPGLSSELVAHIHVCCDTRGTAILGKSVTGPRLCKRSYDGDRNGSDLAVYDVDGDIKEEPEGEQPKTDRKGGEANSKPLRKRSLVVSGGDSNSIPLPTDRDAAAEEAVDSLGSRKRIVRLKDCEDHEDIPTAQPAKFRRPLSSREVGVSGDCGAGGEEGAHEECKQLGSASSPCPTGVESQPDRSLLPQQWKESRKLLWRPDGKSCGVCAEDEPNTPLTPEHFRMKHKLHCPVCLQQFKSTRTLHCHFKKDHWAWAKVAVGKDFNSHSGRWFTTHPVCGFCGNSEIFFSWDDLQTHDWMKHGKKVSKAINQLYSKSGGLPLRCGGRRGRGNSWGRQTGC